MVTKSVLTIVLAMLAVGAGLAQGAARWVWTEDLGWYEDMGKPRGRPDQQLAYAQSLERAHEYNDASRAYLVLIRAYPNSGEADAAMEGLARTLFEVENYYHAFRAVESCLETLPKAAARRREELLALEIEIGRKFLNGAKVSLIDPEKATREASYAAGAEVFGKAVEHDPYGRFAPRALAGKGECLYHLGQYEEARSTFKRLASDFPNDELRDWALAYEELCSVALGGGDLRQAQRALENLERKMGGDGAGEEASGGEAMPPTPAGAPPGGTERVRRGYEHLEQVAAMRMLKQARWYAEKPDQKADKAAAFLCDEIVRRYPGTDAAREARQIRAGIGVADSSPVIPSGPAPAGEREERSLTDRLTFWRGDEEPSRPAPPPEAPPRSEPAAPPPETTPGPARGERIVEPVPPAPTPAPPVERPRDRYVSATPPAPSSPASSASRYRDAASTGRPGSSPQNPYPLPGAETSRPPVAPAPAPSAPPAPPAPPSRSAYEPVASRSMPPRSAASDPTSLDMEPGELEEPELALGRDRVPLVEFDDRSGDGGWVTGGTVDDPSVPPPTARPASPAAGGGERKHERFPMPPVRKPEQPRERTMPAPSTGGVMAPAPREAAGDGGGWSVDSGEGAGTGASAPSTAPAPRGGRTDSSIGRLKGSGWSVGE